MSQREIKQEIENENTNLASKEPRKFATVSRPRREAKNIFTFMEKTSETKCPLSLLYRSIQENRKIKVWTRSHTYVRSICTGYLIAFDRFWNLAMIDVDEIYRVPLNLVNQTSNRALNSLSADLNSKTSLEDAETMNNSKKEELELNRLNESMGLKLSLYKSGNFNLFQRHVNQLLIRGDNVVFAVLAD